MKLKLICNGKKCRKHFKEWKNSEKKRLMHEFLNHWASIRGRELTDTIWWEEFCFEWCEYFGYNYETEYSSNYIKQFSFYLSKNKKLFFKDKWNDFLKCYSEYFYWVK
jgi:hypothetical protein